MFSECMANYIVLDFTFMVSSPLTSPHAVACGYMNIITAETFSSYLKSSAYVNSTASYTIMYQILPHNLCSLTTQVDK